MAVTTSPSWTSSAFTFEIGVRRLRARIRGGVDHRRAGDEAEPGRIDPQHAVLERQIHLAPADRQRGPLDLAEPDVECQIHRIQRPERSVERGRGALFGLRTLRPEAEIGEIEGRDRQLARDPRPGALVLYGEILVDHGPADPRFARQLPPGTLAGQPAGVRQRTQARDVGIQHSADDGTVPRRGVEAEVGTSDRRDDSSRISPMLPVAAMRRCFAVPAWSCRSVSATALDEPLSVNRPWIAPRSGSGRPSQSASTAAAVVPCTWSAMPSRSTVPPGVTLAIWPVACSVELRPLVQADAQTGHLQRREIAAERCLGGQPAAKRRL